MKKGSAVVVETWDCNEDIASAVELEGRLRGHSVITLFNESESFVEFASRLPSGRKLSLGKHEAAMLRKTDGYVFIPGPELSYSGTRVEQSKLRAATSYNLEWYRVASEAGLRGVRLYAGYFNSDRAAAALGRNRVDVVNHLLKASLADPRVLGRTGGSISRAIRTGGRLTFLSGGSVFKTRAGKEGDVDDGRTDDMDVKMKNNMSSLPGGFYSKEIGKTAEGSISCASVSFEGRKMPGGDVEFSDGRIVSYSADKWDEDFRGRFDRYVRKGGNGTPRYLGIGLNPLLKPGYGRDTAVSGAVTIWIGPSAYALLKKPSVSAGELKIVENGKIVL